MSHTKSTAHLSKTVRRMYGKFTPRVRAENEALPVQICNSTVRETYRTGDGDIAQVIDASRMRAYSIPSRGF